MKAAVIPAAIEIWIGGVRVPIDGYGDISNTTLVPGPEESSRRALYHPASSEAAEAPRLGYLASFDINSLRYWKVVLSH